VAGDVITTGTRAADPARVDAPRGSDPVTDAEQAEAGAPDVPGDRTADDTAEGPEGPEGPESPKASERISASFHSLSAGLAFRQSQR
jgi:hypothetical protein